MSIARIKKGDVVIVISGDDAGKTGRVQRVDPRKDRALVEGVNVMKKAVRRSQQHPEGGIVEMEAPIALCKLMPYDPVQKKGVRIRRVREGERAVRKAKGSEHIFD